MYQCSMAHQSAGPSFAQHLDDGTIENAAPKAPYADTIDTATGSTGSADEDCEAMSNQKRASCGTCASCCIGSYAPLPFALLNLVQEPAQVTRPEPISSFAGPFPTRLDRPPRTVS